MLKKLDLARQFELLTQQEIKNYQDSLNDILQSIRDIKKEIQLIKDSMHASEAHRNSLHGITKMDLENIHKDVDFWFQTFKNKNVEKSQENYAFECQIEDHDKSIAILQCEIDSYEHKFNVTDVELRDMKSRLDQESIQRLEQHQRLIDTFCKELKRHKQELMDAPTEASQVKALLDEKIDCHKVDVQGIMREILFFKKENMVLTKKVEALFTLVEKLQKGQST